MRYKAYSLSPSTRACSPEVYTKKIESTAEENTTKVACLSLGSILDVPGMYRVRVWVHRYVHSLKLNRMDPVSPSHMTYL